MCLGVRLMLGVNSPSMSSPSLGKLSSRRCVLELIGSVVVGPAALLPVRIESRLDMVPVIDANTFEKRRNG